VKIDGRASPASVSPSNAYSIAREAVSTTRPCPSNSSLIATLSPARCTIPRANAPPKQQSSSRTIRRERLLVIWRLTNSDGIATHAPIRARSDPRAHGARERGERLG
jgi:hypothetical protein